MRSVLAKINPRFFLSKQQVRFETTYTQPSLAVNPAYQEALNIISNYRNKKLEELKQVESKLKDATSETVKLLEQEKFNLQVEADKHLSEVKWNVRNNKLDLTKPVYRALLEAEFRKRPLEIVMQRAHQMFVIPDVIDPNVFKSASAQLDIIYKSFKPHPIESGIRITASLVKAAPKITFVPFNDTTELYTIVMVNPDTPDEINKSFKQICHFAAINVPFSIHENEYNPEKMGQVALEYLPPHPENGTKAQRYIYVVLRQGEQGDKQLNASEWSRELDLREKTKELDLHPVAVTFFRSEWDNSVDTYYREVLDKKPPRFVHAPAVSRGEPKNFRTAYS